MTSSYKAWVTREPPHGWTVRRVGNLGEVVTGKALAVNAPGKLRPYLRTKNVFDGFIDVSDVLSMPMTDSEFSRFQIRAGDVLLNEGQSLELVGRCSLYRDELQEPCAIQNQLIRFRAGSDVSELFSSYVFRHCQHTGVFAGIALQTTSIAHLGGTRFANMELPWPDSKREQEAIGATLSDVDALIGALDKLIAKKRGLKLAVMQQLLTGQIRLPGFNGKWTAKRLDKLASIRSGGTPSTNVARYWNGEIPWCTPTDITSLNGGKYLTTTSRTITQCGLNDSSAELIPVDSVIMTSRATIGECAINRVPVTTNQGFKNFVPLNSTSTEFLYYALQTQKQGFIRLCAGSTFLEIGKAQLCSYELLFPPTRGEQDAVAATLSDMDAELAALEASRDKTRALKQGMMQELLTGRIRLV